MAAQKLDQQDQEKIKRLGERITAYRKALGYSSHETFANAKNIHRAQYWRYEKGENLKILSLAKLAEMLEVPLEELIKDCF